MDLLFYISRHQKDRKRRERDGTPYLPPCSSIQMTEEFPPPKSRRDLQNTNIRQPAGLTCRSDSRLLGIQQKHITERLPLRVAKRCREQRAPGRRSLRSISPYRDLSSIRALLRGCPFYYSQLKFFGSRSGTNVANHFPFTRKAAFIAGTR